MQYSPRQIFCITDGEVDDIGNCIRIAKKNAHISRVFTFGVGRDFSKALANGIARASNGRVEYIIDKVSLKNKVMRHIQFALQPVYTHVQIAWKATRTPLKLSPMFSNEPYLIYGFLERDFSQKTGIL